VASQGRVAKIGNRVDYALMVSKVEKVVLKNYVILFTFLQKTLLKMKKSKFTLLSPTRKYFFACKTNYLPIHYQKSQKPSPGNNELIFQLQIEHTRIQEANNCII
jgi:hypothetical protein